MRRHHHHSHENASGNLATAFFLNFGFTIVEFIGGLYTNSLAIMSDALHDLGDTLSLGLAWYFQKLSTKKPTKKFSYGFKRFSLLGAIINSIVLVIGSIFIIIEAIPRIIHPEEANAFGMMWLAVLGIIVNGAAALKLKQGKTLNERVVSLHLLEDVLGWTAVLFASIIMQFWDIPVLDPILSLLIACYVLLNVYKNIKESIRIILQGTPKEVSIEKIKETISSFSEVCTIHDCHLWTMDGEYNVLTTHVVLREELSWSETKTLRENIRRVLHDKYHLEHVTLELEHCNEDCEYKDCN
jgi:cobalt-zinc-cadmium efflux system protein